MPHSKKHILVVDDEASIRESLSVLLTSAGYEISEAQHGFDGLLQLAQRVPDVIISDLNMPYMSGFEFLSVVRRRYPQISVVALSGAFSISETAVPTGVIADFFYAKGHHTPERLLSAIAQLINTSVYRASDHLKQSAPVWIPRNGRDSTGKPYFVLTCTNCLRSFPKNVPERVDAREQKTPCIYCSTELSYILDFSRSVASPLRPEGVI